MNKIKQISQKLLVFLAAVTLVAAVVVPESGQDLLYADTNDIVYEQEISEAQDAENEQKSDTAGTEGTLSSPQMENEDSGSGSAETVPESEGDEESIAEQAINDIAEEADQEKGQPEEESIPETREVTETESADAEKESKTRESEEKEDTGIAEENSPEEREDADREDPLEEETTKIPAESANAEDTVERTEEDAGQEAAIFEEEIGETTEEPAFGETIEEDPAGPEGIYIEEEADQEPAFAEKKEKLAGAKTGQLPLNGGICRIQLLKNADTVTGSGDGYVITSIASNKEKQKFFAEKIKKNWRFVNTVTGQALVVTEPDGNGGRFVAFEQPTGGKRELWRLVKYGRGYGLKSVADGRVLTSSSAGNGNYTILTDGKGVSRQTWTFTACQESIAKAEITVDASVGSGAKSLVPSTVVSMGGRLLQMDVDYTVSGGTEVGAAQAVIKGIGNFSGKASRAYEIVQAAGSITDGGFYMLIPRQSLGSAMGAQGGEMLNGTDIAAEQKTGAEHQIFQIKKTGGGYNFINAKSEKVLAPSGNEKGADVSLYASGKNGSEIKAVVRANGAIVLRAANGRYLKNLGGKMVAAGKKITDSAYYYLVECSGPSMTFRDTFYIRTSTRIRLVVGLKSSSAEAVLTNYSNAASQMFEFLYSGSGYYRIVGKKSRKVLTANEDGTITQNPWKGAAGQCWKPVASVNGYLLKNQTGKVMTVTGDVVKNGQSLGASDEDGSMKQIFLLLATGSGEAKKNLVKKPLTIYKGTDYSAVYNYDDYMDRYTNLADIYGTDCAGALQYFVEHGMSEGQHGSSEFDVWCYRRSNPGVRRQLLADIPGYYLHYIRIGRAQGLKASGSFQTTQAADYHDLAWKCYNEWGDYNNRPYSHQMCEILSAAAEVQYQAYGFPKSIVIAMAIKECGFLTFNGGLPPNSNNVLTMNVDMWNGLWKSGWLGGYASVKVPQYDSVSKQLVYGYEAVRCYEDIEACMDDFANFKTTLLGPVPAGMSIEAVVDKYLEGYATSPGYKESILATIKLHQLTRFDH